MGTMNTSDITLSAAYYQGMRAVLEAHEVEEHIQELMRQLGSAPAGLLIEAHATRLAIEAMVERGLVGWA